ncbi:MAG: TIGR04283 family arsenosugar biosynthesis glycosyltransferase, partial [Proteobacteria bacterium]|nr:TIGR04283 family arsenosugar biosynthesis glycosyltransferase [Pseudomonadota bacterium]
GAADLQRRMTDCLVSKVKTWIEQRSLAVEIRFEGGSEKLMRQWLGPSFSYRHQGRGDIGRRMERAIADGFQDGYTSIVIIGSDIPDISSEIIDQAFEELQKNNLVLGPAGDGGYYLIGMQKTDENQAYSELFEAINWGTNQVLSQTITAANQLGIGYALLDTLKDVDRPEDLRIWNRALRSESDLTAKKHISIIIPTLNEANVIEETITRLPQSKQVEIVVVDGGSSDGTDEMARELGARVLSTAPSKAEQMNAGAAEARGEVLLFLHADTRLPANFEEKVMTAVSRKGFCAGAFTLGIDSEEWGLRFIEWIANWRARFFKMPYGDQALFVSRQLFHEIGGFQDYPIMEDFELIRRLKKKGKIAILPESVQTSPRRWQNLGVFKTWFLNQIILAAYFIGIPPHRLARWYRREKGKSGEQNF